jgi:hypothetical protein
MHQPYRRNNNPQQNTNVFGVPAHLTNGYAFHNNNNTNNLDPHSGSATAAAHAAQWNQQQKQLYDQYNAGTNNL